MTDVMLCDADNCETKISPFDEYVTIKGHAGRPWAKWHICGDCATELQEELEGPSKGVIESVLDWIKSYNND